MRVIVAIDSLTWIGGAQTYALTAGEHLQRLGHDVLLCARELGPVEAMATDRGLRAVTSEQLPDGPAVVLANDAAIAYDLADLRPHWPQVVVVHSDIFDSHLPPVLPQLKAVVSLYARVERRLAGLDERPEPIDLRPIDVELRPPARDEPVVPRLRGGRRHADAPL